VKVALKNEKEQKIGNLPCWKGFFQAFYFTIFFDILMNFYTFCAIFGHTLGTISDLNLEVK